MKSRKAYTILIAFIWLASMGSALAFEESTDRGNGGDEVSQAFVDAGYELVESLMKDPVAGVDTQALLRAVEATKVHSEEKLVLRGMEVDAINYPHPEAPRILVSRSGWARMENVSHRRMFLAFHEYLGIMGLDDSRYQISARLDRAGVCGRTPEVRIDIEETLKKSCYRIIEDDLRYVRRLGLYDKPVELLPASDLRGLRKLELLNLIGTKITSVQEEVWPMLRSLTRLWGPSSLSLADCSFFKKMPDLNEVYWGDAVYDSSLNRHRPISAIGPGCFAGSKVRRIGLNVDGGTTKMAGFLQGADIEILSIRGTKLEQIPVSEYLSARIKFLYLDSFDKELSQEFVNELGKATGLGCEQSRRSTPSNEIIHLVQCRGAQPY